MTYTALKLSCLTVFLLGSASVAVAQVPAHGTVPETPASLIFTPAGSYSTSNPNANFEWSILTHDHMGYAPFDVQYLEVSTPNTQPMTLNLLTDPACTQQAIRIFKCVVQYPMTTADMVSSSVPVTMRHYATKNGGTYKNYVRKFGTVTGQAGSVGTSGGGGTGSSIPPVTQIPSHGNITGDTSYQINVSSSLANYSSTNNILPINLVITPNSPPSAIAPPFANELVEIKSPNGAVKSLNIASECTRSGVNNMTLTCNTSYVLPAADASQPNMIFEGRYFANDFIPGTQIIWTGYSMGTTLLQGTTTGGGGGATQNCPPENNPMMPTNSSSNINGSVFTFTQNAADVCGGTFWIDPPIAIGYSYAVSGASFESITLPSLQTVADNNGYSVNYRASGNAQSAPVTASQQYTFPASVTQFEIKGIDHTLGLGLHDPAAFALGVKLINLGSAPVKITQIPMPHSTAVIIDRPVVLDRRYERISPNVDKRFKRKDVLKKNDLKKQELQKHEGVLKKKVVPLKRTKVLRREKSDK